MKLVVENISKKYNDEYVLKNLSLYIDKPGIYPIIGSSGSGKTTLLKIASGLLMPTSGKVLYNDINIFELRFDERARLRNEKIGFIFQDYFLEESFSSLENVEVPLFLNKKLKIKEIEQQAKNALKAVKLENKANQLTKTLSGGESQRVSIARALVNNPDIIFADEPTGNLDSVNGDIIMELLEEISKEKIIILVTHNESIASRYEKFIEIKDGCKVNDK